MKKLNQDTMAIKINRDSVGELGYVVSLTFKGNSGKGTHIYLAPDTQLDYANYFNSAVYFVLTIQICQYY